MYRLLLVFFSLILLSYLLRLPKLPKNSRICCHNVTWRRRLKLKRCLQSKASVCQQPEPVLPHKAQGETGCGLWGNRHSHHHQIHRDDHRDGDDDNGLLKRRNSRRNELSRWGTHTRVGLWVNKHGPNQRVSTRWRWRPFMGNGGIECFQVLVPLLVHRCFRSFL